MTLTGLTLTSSFGQVMVNIQLRRRHGVSWVNEHMDFWVALAQVAGGAGGTGTVLGLWLWRSLKRIDALEAEVKSLNESHRAREIALHESRLKDAQTLLPALNAAAAVISGAEETLHEIADVPPPVRERGEPTGRRKS